MKRRRGTIGMIIAATVVVATASALGEPGDPSSRLPETGSASEYWDLWAHLDTGERIFARFLISNEGPGDHAGVTIGHVVRPDGSTLRFKKGKLKGRWSLSEDGRRVKVGKSILDLHDPVNRFWFESEKQGVEIELSFASTGPAAHSAGNGPSGYSSDVLELGVPVTGWYRVAEMQERKEVRGTVALTHTWTKDSEADVVLRRIEFLSLGDDSAMYLSQLTAPDGTRSHWLAVRENGQIVYRSADFEVELEKSAASLGSPYPIPESLRIRNGELEGKIRLANVVLQHDLFEALPLPFRMLLSFRMRPHRVWTESPYEVELKTPDPEVPPLKLRGTGITSVTFLNPFASPV